MLSKARISSNKRHGSLGLGTPHKRSRKREATTHRTNNISRMETLRTTNIR
jgi:hypothetical protein